MGFLDRVGRVIRSGIKSVVNATEDPEKVLEKAVMEMEDDLIRLRQSVAQAIAIQKRTERQAIHAQKAADEWYRRAQLALQKGTDEKAREALTHRQSYLNTVHVFGQQREQQRSIVKTLKQNMLALERQLTEAKTRKNMYIARVRSAKASQQFNEMLGGLGTHKSMAVFDRMEETIQELEAQSDAIAELTRERHWEQRFAALERDCDVDDVREVDNELAALKARIKGNLSP